MTTYNTGNPIGSKDPRDLYDNAENLDTAVNDTSRDTWSDRLGRSRKTMSGMERQFDAAEDYRETTFVSTQADKQSRFDSFIASSGYQFLGDYAAGIEITEYNQIVRDSDGEFWRLSGQVELPYTTTGAGLPEGDTLTPLGDAVLRQELATGTADVLSGTGAETIRSALDGRLIANNVSLQSPVTDSASVQSLMSRLGSIGGVGEIPLPAGQFDFSDKIASVTSLNSGVTLRGADPVLADLQSIDSVSGSPGNWDVTINASTTAGMSVGDVLCIRDVRPGRPLGLANDPQGLQPGEMAVGFYRLGSVAITEGSSTATFSGSGVDVYIGAGDLVHIQGMTRVVGSVTSGNTLTVTVPFDKSATNFQWWYYSIPDASTAVTVGGYNGVVNFANSITPARANVGDLLVVNGEIRRITEIVSGNQVRVNSAINIPSGSKFTIMAGGLLHEGAWVITAISANKVTVKNRNRFIKPPVNTITAGKLSCIKTILRSTGDGLVFGEKAAISLKSIALVGTGASTTVGIKLNGDLSRSYSQSTGSLTIADDYVAVSGFGNGVTTSGGCTINGYNGYFCGNQVDGLNINEGANAYLRNAILAGNGRRNIFIGLGAAVRGSTIKSIGAGEQGIRMDVGGNFYGDQPVSWGNAGHGVMGVNRCGFQYVDGVSCANGGNGLNLQNTGGGRWSRTLTAGNDNHNVQVINGDLECTQMWASGPSTGRSNIAGSKCRIDADASALTGAPSQGAYCFDTGVISLDGANITQNNIGIRADNYDSLIDCRNARVAGNNSDSQAVNGGVVLTQRNSLGTRRVGSTFRENFVIPDDSVVSFYAGSSALLISVVSPSAGTDGIVKVRASSSPSASVLADGGVVAATISGAATGVSGDDGDFTIFASDDGNIYLENRKGTNRTVTIAITGNIA